MTGQQNKDRSILSDQEISLSAKIKTELAHVHFSSQEKVLRKTHPKKMIDRIRNLWNKEFEIPVAPFLTVSACLIILGIGFYALPVEDLFLTDEANQQRELVDTGVGIYWSDLLEKAVSRK